MRDASCDTLRDGTAFNIRSYAVVYVKPLQEYRGCMCSYSATRSQVQSLGIRPVLLTRKVAMVYRSLGH